MLDRFADASVVMIDDDPSNIALLERLLRRAGLRNLRCYTDAREALARLDEDRPDLVLADLHMPYVDGYGVVAQVARHAGGTYLPVLVLTADTSTDAMRRALDGGARDFISKPFDIVEVTLRVRNLLETRYLHRALRDKNVRLSQQVARFSRSFPEEAEAARAARASRDRIARVLSERSVRAVFQPVVDLATGEVVGVEALARFDCEPQRPPDLWFAEAATAGLGIALEVMAVEEALQALSELPEALFLGLNVSPATLLGGDLRALCGPEVAPRLELELTEHVPVQDYDALSRTLAPYRADGARFAVDDVGAGYAGFRHLGGLRPDIVKLDMSITRGIDNVVAHRALAAALVQYSQDTGSCLVAEGVETKTELETLRGLRVPWGQGFRLGRPLPLAETVAAIDGAPRQVAARR